MSGRRCTYGNIIIIEISLRTDGGGGERFWEDVRSAVYTYTIEY